MVNIQETMQDWEKKRVNFKIFQRASEREKKKHFGNNGHGFVSPLCVHEKRTVVLPPRRTRRNAVRRPLVPRNGESELIERDLSGVEGRVV